MTFLCFGAFFGSMIAMVAIGIRNEDLLLPVALFGSLSIVAVCAMMIRLVSRAAGISVPAGKQPPAGRQPIQAGYPQAQIPAPPGYIPSVTENTTRSFDRQPGESSTR
jgi:hypothetical protein